MRAVGRAALARPPYTPTLDFVQGREYKGNMAEGDETKFLELLKQTTEYSDKDIAELRRCGASVTHFGLDIQTWTQVRVAIETIAAIRRFDKATTKLTVIVIGLVVVQVVVAVISLCVKR